MSMLHARREIYMFCAAVIDIFYQMSCFWQSRWFIWRILVCNICSLVHHFPTLLIWIRSANLNGVASLWVYNLPIFYRCSVWLYCFFIRCQDGQAAAETNPPQIDGGNWSRSKENYRLWVHLGRTVCWMGVKYCSGTKKEWQNPDIQTFEIWMLHMLKLSFLFQSPMSWLIHGGSKGCHSWIDFQNTTKSKCNSKNARCFQKVTCGILDNISAT